MTIAYVGENTLVKQSGASSPASITYPSVTSTNLLVLLIVTGNNANGTVTTPTGWTLLGTSVGGAGTWAPGDGPRRLTVYTKESDGTESGSFNVTWDSAGGAAVFLGQIHQFSKTTGSWGVAYASGDDTSAGSGAASLVITTGTLDMAPGDMVIGFAGGNSDAFITAPAIAASGITFGTYTEQQTDAQSGGYRALYDVATALVSSGTATAAVTLTYDVYGDPASGPGLAIRLREDAGGGGASDMTAAVGAATASTLAGEATAVATETVAAGSATAGALGGSAQAIAAVSPAAGAATTNTAAGGSSATATQSTTAGAAIASQMGAASTAVASFSTAAGTATAATLSSDLGSATFTSSAGTATAEIMAGASVAVASFAAASGQAAALALSGFDSAAPAVTGADGSATPQRKRRRPVDNSPEVPEPVVARPTPAPIAQPAPVVAPPAPEPPKLAPLMRQLVEPQTIPKRDKPKSKKAQKRLAELERQLQEAIAQREQLEEDDQIAVAAASLLLMD